MNAISEKQRESIKHYEPPAGLFDGSVVLVTGASDGIGKAIALQCAALGGRVILHGRNTKKLEVVYDEILASGGLRPSIAVLDLAHADGDAYLALAEGIKEEFGALHGLVHCAGILGQLTPIEQYDVALWQEVMHVNLTAEFVLTQVCLPLLKAAEQAAIVFTSSGVGRTGRAYWGAYSVSKFAVEGFAQVLADELRNSTIRVNTINPGATRTDMRLEAYPAEDRDTLATPAEVTPAFLFALGKDSAPLHGESLDAQ